MAEIKPLRWMKKAPPAHSLDDEDAAGALYAVSVGGCFKITKDALLWTAEDPFIWKQFNTVAEAKTFAQAEHERMIRACLVPERAVPMADDPEAEVRVRIYYVNWRSETAWRTIIPQQNGLRFGTSKWHTEPQWLMMALDVAKNELREFAVKDIKRWLPYGATD